MKVLGHGADAVDFADQIAPQVDDVRAQIAQRAAARHILREPPDHRHVVVRHDPFLQIRGAEVVDAPQRAALDQLAHLADGGHEAVVEGDHVLDARLLHGVEHRLGFLGGARQRLLAEDVLARLRGGNARFGVGVVWSAIVEQLHAVVGQHVAPVGVVAVVAKAHGRRARRRFVAPADRSQLGNGGRRVHHIWNLLERVAVRLAHEGVAQHADADFGRLGFGSGRRHRGEACSFGHANLLYV
jgi:hypothetical protein